MALRGISRSSFSSAAGNNNNNNKNDLLKYSCLNCFRNILIFTVPHLTILAIFIFYTIISASILRELEIGDEDTIITPSLSTDSPINFHDHINEGSILNEASIRMKHEMFLKNLNVYYQKVTSSHNALLLKLTETDALMNDLNNYQTQSEHNNETILFLTQLFKQHKKTIQIEILRPIVDSLIQFKVDLTSHISKKTQKIIKKYQMIESRFQKDFIKLIKHQETYLSSPSQEYTPKDEQQPQEIDKKQLKKMREQKWEFFKSLYFVGTLLTTIGNENSLI
jgi:hypothetical protein